MYRRAAGVTVLSATMTRFAYKRHAHEEYALGVTQRGIQQYRLNGAQLASHRSGVMLFSPEQAHDGNAGDSGGIDYVMVYVPPALFAEATGRPEVVRFDAPIVYDARLAAVVLRLAHGALLGRDEGLTSERLLLAAGLATSMAGGHGTKRQPPPAPRHGGAVRRSMEMIREGMGATLRLDDVCREAGLSKFHFIRLFRDETGMTPYQYFLNCKVEHARHLLEAGADTYDAMLECGFYDLSHLNRHFKAMFGTTATEYRRLWLRAGGEAAIPGGTGGPGMGVGEGTPRRDAPDREAGGAGAVAGADGPTCLAPEGCAGLFR
nr:transcriptional regulator [Nitratidesulfovibrio sp. HK-II]